MNSNEIIEFPAMIDAHVHLRQGTLTARVAPYSASCCSDVIAMPNTLPPIHDSDSISCMRQHYQDALGEKCRVHMTAKWLARTTPADVRAARDAGAIGFKLYPQGVTTNADDGIPFTDLVEMTGRVEDVLGELERQDMVLLCHGEAPGFVMDREALFLCWFEKIVKRHPKLRVTLEHISTSQGIELVYRLKYARYKVLGTITLHHMMRTLDNVVGGKLHPDEFCMPIPKTPGDRDSILRAALSADTNYCFALGSDSAPHEPDAKYGHSGCAGVFSAPVLAQSLVELFGFSQQDACDLFSFTSSGAWEFYQFPDNDRWIRLKPQPWQVPDKMSGIVPFRRGEVIPWTLLDDDCNK